MLLDKLEALLDSGWILLLDELPQRAQVICPMALGNLASLLDLIAAVFARERQQSHEHAATFDAAMVQHGLRPLRSVRADVSRPGAASTLFRARCR